MTKQIDQSELDIVNYRPKIAFVEPQVESNIPIKEPEPSLEDKANKWRQLDKMADAAALLAEAFQAKTDKKVAGFKIALDPNADRVVSDALKRKYPGANPLEITYEQYRTCREAMREHGDKVGRGIAPDLDKVQEIRENPEKSYTDLFAADPTGLISRPDLQKVGQVIEPINVDEFQNKLLCMLMNLLWKLFIKKVLSTLIPPPLNQLIPDEVC